MSASLAARRQGHEWREDEGYTASLGAGWQLEAVREACYAALAAVGKDAMHFRPPSEQNSHKASTCVGAVGGLERAEGGLRRAARPPASTPP